MLNLQTKLLTGKLDGCAYNHVRMRIHHGSSGALCILLPFRVPAFWLSQLPHISNNKISLNYAPVIVYNVPPKNVSPDIIHR